MDIMKLPEEIVIEVLLKLSIKSLVRLSCVCKKWHNWIIQNRYFGDKHLNYWENVRNDDETVVFLRLHDKYDNVKELVSTYNSHSDLDLPLSSQHLNLPVELREVTVFLPCNGILCFAHHLMSSVHLYNPTTLEHLILPPGIYGNHESYACDRFGFGFDQATNDYKVIRIRITKITRARCDYKLGNTHVEMYKVSTNSWSKVENELTGSTDCMHNVGVYVNGFFHWLIMYTLQRRILTFDFEREKFSDTQGPDPHVYGLLFVLDDSLAICSRRWDDSTMPKNFDVWVMKEYGNKESWTKKFSVQFPIYLGDRCPLLTCWVHGKNFILVEQCKHLTVCPLQDGADQKVEASKFELLDCSRVLASRPFQRTLVSLRNRC